MIRSFDEIEQQLSGLTRTKRIGVVAAQEAHTLEAVTLAARAGLVEPVLLGDVQEIRRILQTLDFSPEGAELHQIDSPTDCAKQAAAMVRQGKLDCVMKGKIETAPMMKVLVDREAGIRHGKIMSAVAFMDSPYYHKLFGITDAGLLPQPNLEQKTAVVENAVSAFHALGVETPKVAVLAAVEQVNPKMAETVEAGRLKQMNLDGTLDGCVVEGPISYDLAMDAEAAAIKGYQSSVAGDADILLVPDLASGNLLFKSLVVTGGAQMAGAIIGAMVPMVLTSRSASTRDKYTSILLNALIGRVQEREASA